MNKIILTIALLLISVLNSNSQIKTIESLINVIKNDIIKENSEKFVEPSFKEKSTFNLIINSILKKGSIRGIERNLNSINYELIELKDKKLNKNYIILKEKTKNNKGLGTYIFDLNYKRNVILEVPHPVSDLETETQSFKIFQGIGARAIFIAGAHRCASKKESTCSGKTETCNNSNRFKISDVGHNENTFFQEAHKITLEVKSIVISLHGNNDEDVPDILLSNGTEKKVSSKSLVNRLRDELKTNVASCNSEKDKNYNLCGTTNIQGRLSNNSKNPCTTNAKSSSDLFIHIEQHLNIRKNATQLIEVLNKVLK